jgi:hypothetical protein
MLNFRMSLTPIEGSPGAGTRVFNERPFERAAMAKWSPDSEAVSQQTTMLEVKSGDVSDSVSPPPFEATQLLPPQHANKQSQSVSKYFINK